MRRKLAIGAHPGYADRANFGRLELDLSADEIAESVFEQVSTLSDIAAKCGARVGHVKAHGALYNQAARDAAVAEAIADGVARWRRDVVLVGLAGSMMLDVFRRAGFSVAAEAFADRRYEPNGAQALHIAQAGRVVASDGKKIRVEAQTICIHGDTPGALKIAAAIGERLKNAGIELRPLAAAS
jgi:UPF0271 protein